MTRNLGQSDVAMVEDVVAVRGEPFSVLSDQAG
jgi:hypothetical protein